MAKRPMEIRVRLDADAPDPAFEVTGWLDGPRRTYLWFGTSDKCQATLSAAKLRRLAKEILQELDE